VTRAPVADCTQADTLRAGTQAQAQAAGRRECLQALAAGASVSCAALEAPDAAAAFAQLSAALATGAARHVAGSQQSGSPRRHTQQHGRSRVRRRARVCTAQQLLEPRHDFFQLVVRQQQFARQGAQVREARSDTLLLLVLHAVAPQPQVPVQVLPGLVRRCRQLAAGGCVQRIRERDVEPVVGARRLPE
jgi:hypothetical protein